MGVFKTMDIEIRGEIITFENMYIKGYSWASKYRDRGVSIDYLKGCLTYTTCLDFKTGALAKLGERRD